VTATSATAMTGAVAEADPMGPGRPIVRLGSVNKRFANGTLALSRMSLDLRGGEFVSLLGPSGCGKSTALRLIAGLGEPTSGEIDWPRAQYSAEGKPRRQISFVFQEPTLMPWATVFENVWLPLRLKHVSRIQAREAVMAALERVRLHKFANAYPRELSGGMKMRVSIARALITEPSVLLMDEPFAALDEISRQRLNDDLLRLWESFRWTIVFVTHSVTEAVYLSSRIVVMAAQPGRVIGDIPNALAYPRSAAVRTSAEFAAASRGVSEVLNQSMGEDAHL
jgi:NitT/TauT family transport system ATP-binding protein